MHDDLIANWEPDGPELRLRPLGVLLLEPPVWPHVPWQQPNRSCRVVVVPVVPVAFVPARSSAPDQNPQ